MMSIVDTKSVGTKEERILRELVLALTQMLVNYKTNDDVDEDILLKQENEKYSDKQLIEFIEWLVVLAEIEVELILKSKQ